MAVPENWRDLSVPGVNVRLLASVVTVPLLLFAEFAVSFISLPLVISVVPPPKA